MELQTTITKSNFFKEHAPWMDTITTPGEHFFREKSPQFDALPSLTSGANVINVNVAKNPTIASQFIDIQGITFYSEDTTEASASFNYWPDITTGSISQMTVTPLLSEFRLVSLGMRLAQRLAQILDQMRVYNRQAIYPIVSILEPFMGVTEELNLDMPPRSSITVVAKVIDRGKAQPEFYFE